jgi:hypothetical protein
MVSKLEIFPRSGVARPVGGWGHYINVGNVEIESNKNKNIGEKETLLETVRSLKIEMKIYKADNEKMM